MAAHSVEWTVAASVARMVPTMADWTAHRTAGSKDVRMAVCSAQTMADYSAKHSVVRLVARSVVSMANSTAGLWGERMVACSA